MNEVTLIVLGTLALFVGVPAVTALASLAARRGLWPPWRRRKRPSAGGEIAPRRRIPGGR